MRVLVIEDEPLAAQKMCGFIERYDDSIKIAASLESLKEIENWFRSNPQPDLIFSDIELLDGNVFEFFENARINCPIIFTTAYDKFLLKAFEHSGIAYLLKPFTFENFVNAMQKLEKLKQNFVFDQIDFLKEIQSNFIKPKYKERFIIKLCGELKRKTYFKHKSNSEFTKMD